MIILVAAGLVSAGCGGGGGPAGNKTLVIKYSQPHPNVPGYFGSPISEATGNYWEEAIETVTEGRIDIEIYTSETLNKQELAYDALSSGIADIAWCIASYSPEWVPLELVFYLPIDMGSLEMNYEVHSKLYEEYLLPDYQNRGLINITTLGREAYIVYSPYKPVHKIEDFQGMTIMTSGKSMEQLISRLGALSITLAWNDCYEALEKGTLDCSALDITLPISFRWYEVGDPGYIIDVGGIGNAQPHYNAREDLMSRMRPEDAYAVLKLTDVWYGARGSMWGDAGNILYWDEVANVGMEFIDWPESEKQKLRDMKEDIYWNWFLQWMEDEYQRGDEAEALLTAVLEEMDNFVPCPVDQRPPGNPASYPHQEDRDNLADFGWYFDEWDEWCGPDGHWGMDWQYPGDYTPWYETWWEEQGLGEHPWYANWKAQHGE